MRLWDAPPGGRRDAGFTLLEVMIAVTIMTIAFAAILSSQSASIFRVVRTKDLNVAGMLAQNLMTESEQLMEGKPFNLLKTEETGVFKEPYERFSWKREVKEVQFPDLALTPPKAGGGEGQGGEGGGGDEMGAMIAKTVGKHLGKTLRELVITVKWASGKEEQRIQVATYLVNLEESFDFGI